MALGKQYKLQQIPELVDHSCNGCWFEYHCNISACPCNEETKHAYCIENKSIWVLKPVNKK